ncbi:hypothetical protein IGI04_042573 [Brassica rapa subsp. trilocularis]|uniref:Uncharacterized protein n=1 Tax=Brassica rapa subsp. trilocularis TaxID=1813537 RepID=A0ABQ7KKU9_BRACM|nr:hypothetical protein IGI04_042573 [Brassica rapa subsp. trilocularis]
MVQDGGHELKVKEVGDNPHSQVQQSMAGFMKDDKMSCVLCTRSVLSSSPIQEKEEGIAHCHEQWRAVTEVVMSHWLVKTHGCSLPSLDPHSIQA